MLYTNGSLEICQERMFVKQRRKHCWSSYLLVALTELRKNVITYIVPRKNTQKFIFAWKIHKNLGLHKKTTQNFTCMWPEHSAIVSSWTLKCNASAVVVAETCEYHRTCCDYLVASACQDGSAWNQRKKLQHFHQLVLNMFWESWKSYARTFRCLALLRWERTRGKGAMRAIVGRIFYCCLLNSKSLLICMLGSSKKFTSRSLNNCFFADQRVLFFAMPFLP